MFTFLWLCSHLGCGCIVQGQQQFDVRDTCKGVKLTCCEQLYTWRTPCSRRGLCLACLNYGAESSAHCLKVYHWWVRRDVTRIMYPFILTDALIDIFRALQRPINQRISSHLTSFEIQFLRKSLRCFARRLFTDLQQSRGSMSRKGRPVPGVQQMVLAV